jgi:K+-sensing histidine kinase KdpD
MSQFAGSVLLIFRALRQHQPGGRFGRGVRLAEVSEDIVKALVDFAQEKGVSRLILGRPRRSVLSGVLRRSIPERLIMRREISTLRS